jgi:hypothetical protein
MVVVAAGCAPALAHSEFATVVPSDCWQVTLRVSVAVAEQVELGALHALVFQL